MDVRYGGYIEALKVSASTIYQYLLTTKPLYRYMKTKQSQYHHQIQSISGYIYENFAPILKFNLLFYQFFTTSHIQIEFSN